MTSYCLCEKGVLVRIKMGVKIILLEPHCESMSNTIHSTMAGNKIPTSVDSPPSHHEAPVTEVNYKLSANFCPKLFKLISADMLKYIEW